MSQTKGNFNAPVESFEHGVWTDHIWINDNPINFYCFGNAVLMEDNMENKKPEKRVDTQRIDGVITMLMCQPAVARRALRLIIVKLAKVAPKGGHLFTSAA